MKQASFYISFWTLLISLECLTYLYLNYIQIYTKAAKTEEKILN